MASSQMNFQGKGFWIHNAVAEVWFAGGDSWSREIGSVIQGTGNVRLAAGNDLNIRAGAVASTDGALVATARNATRTTQEAHASQTRTGATGVGKAIGAGMVATGMPGGVIWGGALIKGGSSGTGAEVITRNEAIGTTVSAGSLQTVSGRDITLKAATVVADGRRVCS